MNYKDLFEYNIGSIVYLRTDKDQAKRIVTGIQITPGGVSFRLACGPVDTWHYAIEITAEVDILIKTDN